MQNQAKYSAVIATILYLALFFPSFYIGMLSPPLFENANITTVSGVLVVTLSLLEPLALVVSVCTMWYMYFQEEYYKVFFWCLFPLFVGIAIVIIFKIIELIAL